MKYVLIASDEKAVKGFDAMGVEARYASSREEARSAFLCAAESRGDGAGAGTVLVSRGVMDYIGDLVSEHGKKGIFPAVIVLDC